MKKYAIIGISLALAILIVTLVLLDRNPAPDDVQEDYLQESYDEHDELYEDPVLLIDEDDGYLTLAFSETGHFFTSGVTVDITTSIPDARVYYTIDGSIPTTESNLFTQPLDINHASRLGVQAVVLRAIAVYDEMVTRPLTHTYFFGGGVDTRFSTLIFSLSTNEEHLFDHETGIFVGGRLREDFIRDNPDRDIIPPDPANFNERGRESERPIHVEVITQYGERVLTQAAGARTHGGWSRGIEPQKSIRLIARTEYEPTASRFNFDFFGNDYMLDEFGAPLSRFNTLILRNGANDRDFGMLRTEVGFILARKAGLPISSPVAPVAIFLNGEYYGFAWLHVRMDVRYLQDKFNRPRQDFDLIGSGEGWTDTDNYQARQSFYELNSFAHQNLLDDEIFEHLVSIVDIDELLLYYALQIYLGNEDWPWNNLRLWRYTGEQVEGLPPELDGRWRYVVYDLDWILGLYHDVFYKPTFTNVIGGESPRSPLLTNILTRPDMANKFTMIMNDIAANLVTEQIITDLINYLYDQSRDEIGHAINANFYSHWVSHITVGNNHAEMIYFASRRHEIIFSNLIDHFGFEDEMFEVEVTGGLARIGTQVAESSRYFSHLVVPIAPYLPRFYAFDHWVLNGERIYEELITISIEDAIDGVVNLTLITRPAFPILMFESAYEAPDSNGLVLTNPSDETIDTAGLFLSNNSNDLKRFPLPSTTIEPGGYLVLAGRRSDTTDDRIIMSFNVQEGRMLILSDENGVVIDTFNWR